MNVIFTRTDSCPHGPLDERKRTSIRTNGGSLTPIGTPPTTSRLVAVTSTQNPMLREPLTLAHIKPLVVGHWGTTRGRISSTSI